ncbi:MAG: ribbon-helix-helix protein, CopG family [Chloroflexi bacterium]|nr:ribbon-helix-helix protein, CopG family [Chloroflexota bacterium]
MSNVKTAISLEKPLFEEVEALAEEMKVSRSSLFALAAKEFIQRYKSQKLLEAINAAYAGSAEVEEAPAPMRAKHLELVKGEW